MFIKSDVWVICAKRQWASLYMFLMLSMQKELQQSRTVEDLLEMEMRYCAREPYRSMGRYYHICARKL